MGSALAAVCTTSAAKAIVTPIIGVHRLGIGIVSASLGVLILWSRLRRNAALSATRLRLKAASCDGGHIGPVSLTLHAEARTGDGLPAAPRCNVGGSHAQSSGLVAGCQRAGRRSWNCRR